jgi:hypothetical protein
MGKKIEKASNNLLVFLHNKILALSTSKLFAGMMIILLNISSKFVTIKLSKSMESYLKYTFSRNVLIFAIAFVGSRDIYVATFITLLFILFMDYLLNEESGLCILPDSFKEYHINLVENMENVPKPVSDEPTIDQINQAIKVLSRVRYNR